jgi:HAE1 family hydrophobic/amphiphilic exporter-1
MIFGMLPLSLGLTEGAEERASMGTVLIGGLVSSLLLTLVLVPIMYTWIMGRVEHARARRRARQMPQSESLSDFERSPVSTSTN